MAIQTFVWSQTPGVMYKCFYKAARQGLAASAHVMRYSRVSVADASLEASSSSADVCAYVRWCVTCVHVCV